MKILLRLFLLFFFVFYFSRTYAQKQAYIWHFGDSICLDFTSGAPVQVTGSSLWSLEGSASYCDAAGNLLFYTNGGGREALSGQDAGHIWNSNNAVMYDMQGVEGGGFSSKQSAVAFEAPGQAEVYYLFTMDELEFDAGASSATNAAQPNGRGLRYFKIDMSQNNGLGAVVSANQPVYEPSAEGLCAIRHANGVDYWVLINQDSTGIGVYSVTSAGVNLAGVFNFPFLLIGIQAIKASPKGDYVLAQLSLSITSGKPHLFQFNNATGVLSNPILLSQNFADGEFSPNGRYLYGIISGSPPNPASINQYDLQSANIPASAVTIANSTSLLTIPQTGPDGKIYILAYDFTAGAVSLNRINCPNTSAPTFETSVFNFPNTQFFSLPNFPAWIFENDNDQFVSLGADTLLLCNSPSPIILDAKNPGATYLWSTGATTQTITVTAPGTYSVTVTGDCGTGTDDVVVVDCFSSSDCDLISSPDTIRVCAGDTIQLQSNLSAYSNITQIQWQGGSGVFIPSDTVASPRYVPTASEIAQGSLSLSIRIDASTIDTTSPGRLLAYDHESNDLIFAISPINGSVDSIQDNLGIDWVATGFESSSSILYGLSAFSSFSSVNIQSGASTTPAFISGVNFYAGDFDNVHGIFYAVGNIPSPAGTPVDQFLCSVNTGTGAYNIIGNLNLFTTNGFYYGTADGINGLAYDPGQDVLYGVTFNGKLFRINVNTGAATFVGNTVNDLRGLAYDPVAAKLWGTNNNGTLHEINKNTGALVSTVNCQVPFNFVTSLTYARSSTLVPVVCYDSVLVQISPVPSVSLNTLNDSCSRTTFPFLLNTNGNINAVSWNFGDPASGASNTSASVNTSHAFSAPGNYTVTMAVNLECLIDTLSRNVRVLPQPIVSVSSDVTNITSGDSARLSATGALNYLWSPSSGLSCSSCPAPSAAPSGTTTYVLTGTNAQGCAASDSITIRVDIKCNEFFIPDIFSPNGTGNLVNEKLCAYSNCIRLFSFIIFNRWGEQVFETTDIAACWDGTYKGKESPSGIYAFKLYAEQIDGTIVDKKGTITLVR